MSDVLLRSLGAILIRHMEGGGERQFWWSSHIKARPSLANCSQSPWKSDTLQPAQACLLPDAELMRACCLAAEGCQMILKLPTPLPSKVMLQARIKRYLAYAQLATHGCLLPACRGPPSCSGSWVPQTKRGTACCWR